MKGEQAMEIFNLVKAKKMLTTKLDELVPMSFIGDLAVKFAQEKINLMEKLNMAESQRKATLKDGQGAGELLLTIEGRIGALALKEPKAKGTPVKSKQGGFTGTKPSGKEPKHKRLGIDRHRMDQSQQIAKHPEIVEKVKARAKENEDIPTKTAVLSEIKYQKAKERIDKMPKMPKKRPDIDDYVNSISGDMATLTTKLRRIKDQTQHIQTKQVFRSFLRVEDELRQTLIVIRTQMEESHAKR